MLEALGRKDWDAGLACMTEDVLCDWPYLPIPETVSYTHLTLPTSDLV